MEKNRTFLIIVLMMALVLIWRPLYVFVGQKLGYDMTTKELAETPATQPTTNPSVNPTTQVGMSASAPTMSSAAISAVSAAQPSRTELGSAAYKDKTFPLAIRLVSEGASIDSVILNDYRASVTGVEPYTYQHPYEGFESASRPLATRSVTIDGNRIDLADLTWRMVESSQQSAKYSIDLNDATGKPLARVTKSFDVFDRKNEQGGGYEVAISHHVDNLTAKSIEVAIEYNGPTTPPQELDRGSDRMLLGGYLNGQSVYIHQNYVESFGAKQTTYDYTKSDKNDYPLLWAGVASIYFDAIVRPVDEKSFSPSFIEKVLATSLNPEQSDSKKHAVVLMFRTKPLKVEPGTALTLANRAYFGPKERAILTNPYFSQLPRGFDASLVITSGFCGFCTFSWLINALVAMLNFFHTILFKDWGLAIIALVFIVRFILHPITKKSQINMSQMSKFGPEIEKLKEKHKDDTDALNKAMMQFYKEHGATPILGCLPMFLQMPIWIALWSALQSTFELRHAGFLRFGWGSLTWIKDLSQPDHLITLSQPITILGLIPVSGLNILPILLGIVFFIQQKYFTPKPPTMTAEQAQQQKMMQWMSMLFPIMLYPGPSGLNLYILASTTFGIIESKRIRDHIKQREEAEKAGRVFVDPGKKFGGGGGNKPKDPPKQSRVGGWLSGLQAKAEQMQREQERRKRGKA